MRWRTEAICRSSMLLHMNIRKSSWANDAFPQLNARMPGAPAREFVREIEEYPFIVIAREHPRVAKAIELTWGHPELDVYLQKLIVADRGGREGFSRTTMSALMKLSKQHSEQFRFGPSLAAVAPTATAVRTPRDTRRNDQQW
jgi:hypothetical protein